MRALDRKLLRDAWQLRGQVLTIALVVACGIASFVALQTTYGSLAASRTAYYERARFADVFAHCKRAPRGLAARLERLPGVARVEVRVADGVLLPMPGLREPATGTVISLPGSGPTQLDALTLRAGRWLAPGHADEALVLETFARAHGLGPGDRVPVVLNGALRHVRIAGLVLSPEYVFAVPPGAMLADDKRFAVLYMDQAVAAPAFQLEGAFDDVAVQLQPGASVAAVRVALDRELAPYGGRGAVARDKQPSNAVLEGELAQLRGMATTVPLIFLFVAAYLLNVVLSRLVLLQRGQIAALKALGYADWRIALHFLELVVVIVAIGAALGTASGAWLGRAFTELYMKYFRLPVLVYRLQVHVVAIGFLTSLAAGTSGALLAVRAAVRLPPAEAMRPPAPARYRRTLLERVGLGALLGPAGKMVLREITRQPLRVIFSALGIAFAVAILIVGRFGFDALEGLIETQFHQAWGEDVRVDFRRSVPARAVRALAHLPGVLRAERLRSVPVRLRAGARYRDSVIFGYADGDTLRRVVDREGRVVALPAEGVALTSKLAEVLGLAAGQMVEFEPLLGDRRARRIMVTALVDEPFGMQGHARLSVLEHALGERDVADAALLRVDPHGGETLERRLTQMPAVASVTRIESIIASFRGQSGESMGVTTFVLTVFAVIIAVGVVYNNARVALSMRARDLASLRVLGLTRAEISWVLLGELALQVLLAVPLGLWLGTLMARGVAASADPETYRLPVHIRAESYAFAAAVALASGAVSALLVRRQLDRLDLIAVLKTRE